MKPTRKFRGSLRLAAYFAHHDETHGPTLAPAQEFSYDGSTYTIMSVNPARTASPSSVTATCS
jgi:hypothetical protein